MIVMKTLSFLLHAENRTTGFPAMPPAGDPEVLVENKLPVHRKPLRLLLSGIIPKRKPRPSRIFFPWERLN